MHIQINWLLQKPTDLDLHCLLRQGMSCSAREGLIIIINNDNIIAGGSQQISERPETLHPHCER